MDIVGEAYNNDSTPVVAISYGVASNNPYQLKVDLGYIKPEMVTALPDVILPPLKGPSEAADEVYIFK